MLQSCWMQFGDFWLILYKPDADDIFFIIRK